MGVEIERKFLVDKNRWQQLEKPEGTLYKQGYLLDSSEKVVRVRVAGENGYITIKGKSEGFSRKEYEYKIPVQDAEEMLAHFSGTVVEKTRVKITVAGKTWEVDEFAGANQGLLLAELELEHESEAFEHPEWLAEEVTEDERYYNVYLAKHPFSKW
ncbi:CYTH domain-containing protein [Mucilaginibacter robiniae]|uniref:CYTH domain-containing protein n=1 Tax=Mucilaginibacter robiniae TaxID=2728022 RepID=A0A7L5E665_9SPHI|nr:CYTH domain-containing protein [Mucilaginibacter robiniae]QJD96333.1 CYTH domain-containing protein [Mucilaginibacter robiniae]